MPNIKSIKYLTQDELKRLLGVITSKRDKAIFLIAYRHGLRASEVGMLKLQDADVQRGRIRIIRLKHSLSGEYPMQPDEIKALKTWTKERKDTNPWLFPSQRGSPISRFTLDKLIKSYGQKAGIPADKRHFHVLKHSIATHLRDANADIGFVKDWIGHRNIQNTMVYADMSNPERDNKARKLFASPMIVGT